MSEERKPKDAATDAQVDDAPADAAAPAGDAPQPSAEEQVAELRDKLLRAMAEAENTRRRAEKEKQEAAKYGITKFARDLLSVADNMRRAMDAISPEERDSAGDLAKNLLQGVEMVEKELLGAFAKHGIAKIDTPGEKFDPNKHQAVAEIPGTGQPDGTVVEIFQVGYVVEDRLLRPAMVTVAKGAAAPEEGGQSRQEPGGGMTGEAGGA